MYDWKDPSVTLSLIRISHAVERVNSIEGSRVGGLMLFMELWVSSTHTHTHKQYIWPFVSLFLSLFLLFSLLLLQSSTTQGSLLNRALGREHIPSFQNETSLIFLFPLVSFLSLFSLHPALVSESLCSSLYFFLPFISPTFISYFIFLVVQPSSCRLCLWTR